MVSEQLVLNSQTGWHQSEVLNIINFLVSTGLMSMCFPAKEKQTNKQKTQRRSVCQVFIYISQGTGSLVILLCGGFIVPLLSFGNYVHKPKEQR